MTSTNAPLRGRVSEAVARFTAPLATAAAWTAVNLLRTSHVIHGHAWAQAQVFLVAGFLGTLAVSLFAESRGLSRKASFAGSVALTALLALIVSLSPETTDSWVPVPVTTYLLWPGLLLLVTVAGFLTSSGTNQRIWEFNVRASICVAFGVATAVAIGLGISVAYSAILYLLGIDLPVAILEHTWVICGGVVFPLRTLIGFPKPGEVTDPPYDPGWVRFSATWVLVPLAALYLIVLIGFGAKILLQWDLPQGKIGWLVAGFAVFGFAAWSAVLPYKASTNPLVRLYLATFHFGLLVPAALLAAGMARRIGDYGITEPRFVLLTVTLWLTGMACVGIFTARRDLRAGPLSLAALLLLGSFGPWGATAMAARSQMVQLEDELGLDEMTAPRAGEVILVGGRRAGAIIRFFERTGRRRMLHDRLAELGVQVSTSQAGSVLIRVVAPERLAASRAPALPGGERPDRQVRAATRQAESGPATHLAVAYVREPTRMRPIQEAVSTDGGPRCSAPGVVLFRGERVMVSWQAGDEVPARSPDGVWGLLERKALLGAPPAEPAVVREASTTHQSPNESAHSRRVHPGEIVFVIQHARGWAEIECAGCGGTVEADVWLDGLGEASGPRRMVEPRRFWVEETRLEYSPAAFQAAVEKGKRAGLGLRPAG